MCGVFVSRRGLVYFFSSIHMFVTFILFIGSSVRAYRMSTYTREDSSNKLIGAIIIALYFFVLLVLGCLIFRGVEKRRPKLLGYSVGIFLTLETIAFVFNLAVLSPNGWKIDSLGLRNFGFTVDLLHIFISCLILLLMMSYCVIVILYICKLRDDESNEKDESLYGEYDDGETHTAATARNTAATTPGSTGSTVHLDLSAIVTKVLAQHHQLQQQQLKQQIQQQQRSSASSSNIRQALQTPGGSSFSTSQPNLTEHATVGTGSRQPSENRVGNFASITPHRYRYSTRPEYGNFDRGYSYSHSAINTRDNGNCARGDSDSENWAIPRVQALRNNYYKTFSGKRNVAFSDYGVLV